MSDIEYLDPSDQPFARLTISRFEAAVIHAALGELHTGVREAIDNGDYGDLGVLSDAELGDIAFDIFDQLGEALEDEGVTDAFSADPYDDFFEDSVTDVAEDDVHWYDGPANGGDTIEIPLEYGPAGVDICPDCGEPIDPIDPAEMN